MILDCIVGGGGESWGNGKYTSSKISEYTQKRKTEMLSKIYILNGNSMPL